MNKDSLTAEEELRLSAVVLEKSLQRLLEVCYKEKAFLHWQNAHPFLSTFMPKKRQRRLFEKVYQER